MCHESFEYSLQGERSRIHRVHDKKAQKVFQSENRNKSSDVLGAIEWHGNGGCSE